MTLLYPLPGEARQIRGAAIAGPYVVSGPAADTSLWVVWSRAPIAELEELRPLVNETAKGIVGNRTKADAVRRLVAGAETRAGVDLVVHKFSWHQR
ncbi:MAG TPA: hypothetical protein VF921_03945 [Vicinamibacterales bacterium]